MVSLSRLTVGGCTLAFALSLTIAEKPLAAQGAAQDTTHKKGTMPMNMPMGKQTQKKKTTSKTGKLKKPGTAKRVAVTAKKSVQMPDTAHHIHPDSARGGMGAMQMQPAPAKTDSMKIPGMRGMDMKRKPADSMEMAMPGMSPHTADDMMIGPVGISM